MLGTRPALTMRWQAAPGAAAARPIRSPGARCDLVVVGGAGGEPAVGKTGRRGRAYRRGAFRAGGGAAVDAVAGSTSAGTPRQPDRAVACRGDQASGRRRDGGS